MSIVINTSRLYVFLWKELREYTRDKKALIITIAIPPLALIAIGLITVILSVQRPVVVSIVNLDEGDVSREFISLLKSDLSRAGYRVLELSDLSTALSDPEIDLVVVIPSNFTHNATSLVNIAYIDIYKRAGVSSELVEAAESTVKSSMGVFSAIISARKIGYLAEQANITVNVEAVRNPVQVRPPVYVGVFGEPATVEDVWRPFIARLLILSFSFIVTPASSYIIDGIIGERERKTMELLLASPLGLREFLIVKIIAASIIGLIAALSDLLGLYLYTSTLAFILGGFIFGVIDLELILLHAAVSFLTILTTISISLPFISRTRGIKSASSVATLISTLGLAFFIAGWIVDFYKLPSTILKTLLVVPYTYSILAIQAYVYRDSPVVAGSLLVLLALSIVLVFISTRILDREKVLLAQTYYS